MTLVSRKLKEREVADKETYKIEPSYLMDIISCSDNWVIFEDGLGIQFHEYDFGFRSAPLIKIDWDTLDPYLSKNGHSLIYE